MSRKRTDVAPLAENQEVPLADPVETNGTTNGEKRRPTASWKFPAAQGVIVEVACWPNTIQFSNGGSIEVFNTTLTRSYKDSEGNWQKGGSFRTSELPVVIHALQKAHAFALDSRELSVPI